MSAVQQWQLASASLSVAFIMVWVAWILARKQLRRASIAVTELEVQLQQTLTENDRLRDCLAKMRPFPPS